MSTGRLPSTDGGIQPTVVDAKGDLLVGVATDSVSRLAVGSNNQVLTADSTTATGLKWATLSGSDISYTLLNAGGTSLSGSTTTVSFTAYNYLLIAVELVSTDASNSIVDIRFNSNSSTNYIASSIYLVNGSGNYQQENGTATRFRLLRMSSDSGSNDGWGYMQVSGAKSTSPKVVNFVGSGTVGINGRAYWGIGRYTESATITSVSIISDNGSFDGGTVYIYGAN